MTTKTNREKVFACLDALGENTGFSTAKQWFSRQYGGTNHMSEAPFYQYKKEWLNERQKKNGQNNTSPTNGGTTVQAKVPGGGVVTAPVIDKTETMTQGAGAADLSVSTSEPSGATQTLAVEDVTFAELKLVAEVVRRMGREKVTRCLTCLEELTAK